MDNRTAIFSSRADLVVFGIGPLLVTFFVWLYQASVGPTMTTVDPVVFLALFVFLDHFHVYLGIGTALKIGTKNPARQRNFYLLFPPICFAAYLGLNLIGSDVFSKAFAYASIFHFGRQQLGWMRISDRGDKRRKLSDICTYANTFGFVAYGASTHMSLQWFSPGDIGKLPGFLTSWILTGIVLINLAYLGLQFYRPFNRTKCLVWLSTLLVWGVAFGWYREFNAISLSLIVAQHAIPSIWISYLYIKKRISQKDRFNKTMRGLGGMAILFSGIEFAASATDEGVIWLGPLLATASTFHYAIDSFFWREKHNQGCLEF